MYSPNCASVTNTTSQPCSLLSLPDELLSPLISRALHSRPSYFSATKWLLRLARTCRRLHLLTQPLLWAHPNLTSWQAWIRFLPVARENERLAVLVKGLRVDWKTCLESRQLQTSYKRPPVDYTEFRIPVFPNCQRLELHLAEACFSTGKDTDTIPFVEMIHWIVSCPILRSLTVRGLWRDDEPSALKPAAAELKSLVPSTLSRYSFDQHALSNPTFSRVWEWLPAPTTLHLRSGYTYSHIRAVGGAANTWGWDSIPNAQLTRLHVSGEGHARAPEWIKLVPESFPALKRLRFDLIKELPLEEPQPLVLTHLEEMEVDVDLPFLASEPTILHGLGPLNSLRCGVANRCFPALNKLVIRAKTRSRFAVRWKSL